MIKILAWTSFGFFFAAWAALVLICFKRQAWWLTRQSLLDPLNEKEIRIAKLAGVFFVLTVLFGLLALAVY